MTFFDIDHIFFSLWNYDVSYLEFYGLISGIIAVTLSSLANVWSWPVGIINVVLSFILFFQVRLYPDMALQVFFFITNVVGWWRWTHPNAEEEDMKHELKVSFLKQQQVMVLIAIGVIGTLLLGSLASNIHTIFPKLFTQPSAAPFLDSFITVMSIMATFYMIQKKIECWMVWLLVDIIATYVYFSRDIKFYAVLYFIYCIIASFALWNWIREYRSYAKQAA